jgi:uncharacterized cupredoxin-like copper-binding protein
MKRVLFIAVVVVLASAAACGGGGGDDDDSMNMEGSTGSTGASPAASRTVEVTMIDIAYEPKTLNVQRGERIEFVFHNQGKIAHDAFIGDTGAQGEHEKEMREADPKDGGHMGGSEAYAVTVEPGKTERLAYTFDKPGTIEIGCHQSGHYAAGMKVAVTVT